MFITINLIISRPDHFQAVQPQNVPYGPLPRRMFSVHVSDLTLTQLRERSLFKRWKRFCEWCHSGEQQDDKSQESTGQNPDMLH